MFPAVQTDVFFLVWNAVYMHFVVFGIYVESAEFLCKALRELMRKTILSNAAL